MKNSIEDFFVKEAFVNMVNAPPKEGELYKRIQIGNHVFELKYGYYTESDRILGEPVVLYPDLKRQLLHDHNGKRIVTAIQDPCRHYLSSAGKASEECCCDCEHYRYCGDDIGICACTENDRSP